MKRRSFLATALAPVVAPLLRPAPIVCRITNTMTGNFITSVYQAGAWRVWPRWQVSP